MEPGATPLYHFGREAGRPTFRAHPEDRAPRRRPTPSPPCPAPEGPCGPRREAAGRERVSAAARPSAWPARAREGGGAPSSAARGVPPFLTQGFLTFTAACARCRHLVTGGEIQLPKILEALLMVRHPCSNFFFREVFITVPPCISPREAPPVPFRYVSAPTSHSPSPRERVGEDSHFRLSLRE